MADPAAQSPFVSSSAGGGSSESGGRDLKGAGSPQSCAGKDGGGGGERGQWKERPAAPARGGGVRVDGKSRKVVKHEIGNWGERRISWDSCI